MNSKGIGVLGPNTGRAAFDRQLEAKFNPSWRGGRRPRSYELFHGGTVCRPHTGKRSPPYLHYRGSPTTEFLPQGNGNACGGDMPEEGFSYRTKFDKKMLTKFDQIYNENAQVREEYSPSLRNRTGFGRHSLLQDDPYQPYSYYQSYVNIS